MPRACSLASLVHVASEGRACSPPVLLLLHPPHPFPPTHGCLVGRGGLWVPPGARAHATASPPTTLSSHPHRTPPPRSWLVPADLPSRR